MKRFTRKGLVGVGHRGQEGVTLIELLIVIVILGILAGIVIPSSVGAFKRSGTLNAANSEVQQVKTAATAYLAEHDDWPATSALVVTYLDKAPKATYAFNTTSGSILATGTSPGTWGTDIQWDEPAQKWVKGA